MKSWFLKFGVDVTSLQIRENQHGSSASTTTSLDAGLPESTAVASAIFLKLTLGRVWAALVCRSHSHGVVDAGVLVFESAVCFRCCVRNWC